LLLVVYFITISDLLGCYIAVDDEFESRSFEELCADIKEPEEADHKAKCHLLHDGRSTNETVPENSDGWMNVLGHDRLRKRVSCALVYKVCLGETVFWLSG